ncbi:hypothetical protein GCM10007301_42760 [Azorhizobium oxalatiphilum]|uniref:Chitooligosaccharide deacetylase n=1 Tax=Azorhizobium oxalatiphilum TaxID=980631 RepID=A0A917C9H7_9HYPH|nr:polysaccharide deacetylase family protein [Azorhizobium oxalatiphilum]GGF78223.1 hypothetical protein GCM10007301_42760 [Azorhizobium oxalatiphilum]
MASASAPAPTAIARVADAGPPAAKPETKPEAKLAQVTMPAVNSGTAATGQATAGGIAAAASPVFAPPVFGPQATPAPEAPKGPASYRSAEVDGPYIAITFDDGPNPETTPKLLKMLEARGIKATFFMLGSNAVANPDVVRAVAAAGHEIGNHSWNHPQLPKLTEAAVDKQIEDTNAAIQNVIGKKPIYLRPPYGAMTPALQRHVEQKYGMSLIYWSVDPLDWKIRDAESIYNQITTHVRPGSIILAHDIHATTVSAMPRVLDALIAKGYKFVTVSELIAMNKPKAVAALAPAATPAQPRKKPRPPQHNAANPRPANGTVAAANGAAKPANAQRPANSNAAVPGAPLSITPTGGQPLPPASVARNVGSY